MYIYVVDYDANWPQEFERESQHLQKMLGQILKQAHHIGSTAVPRLKAKPIIDILLEVHSLSELDAQTSAMEKLGYEVMGELGIKGRRYFRKGGDNRTHQIHAFQSGDSHLTRHLAFRDYLIEHEAIAREYGELKAAIAQRCNHDIEQYCDEKDPFVIFHEKKALVWYTTRNNN